MPLTSVSPAKCQFIRNQRLSSNPTHSTRSTPNHPNPFHHITGVNFVGYMWSFLPLGIGPFPPTTLQLTCPKNFWKFDKGRQGGLWISPRVADGFGVVIGGVCTYSSQDCLSGEAKLAFLHNRLASVISAMKLKSVFGDINTQYANSVHVDPHPKLRSFS